LEQCWIIIPIFPRRGGDAEGGLVVFFKETDRIIEKKVCGRHLGMISFEVGGGVKI
jgi:hypothetical protein